jgi:hypothetical protein
VVRFEWAFALEVNCSAAWMLALFLAKMAPTARKKHELSD